MRNTTLSLLISAALVGGLAFAAPTLAQDSTDAPTAPAAATSPEEGLLERHGEASAAAIAGLRAGSDFVIDGAAVNNSVGAMGYGEIDATLSLANALVESGAAADLASALDADVLPLRAEGMAWGEIAQTLGFNLGEVMSTGRVAAGLGADVAAGAAGLAADTAAGGVGLAADTAAGVAASADSGVAAAEAELARSIATAGSANANVSVGANADARVGVDRAIDARAGAGVRVDAGLGTRAVRPERPETRERPATPERPALPPRPQLPLRTGLGG